MVGRCVAAHHRWRLPYEVFGCIHRLRHTVELNTNKFEQKMSHITDENFLRLATLMGGASCSQDAACWERALQFRNTYQVLQDLILSKRWQV